jgi:hypothetical protein
VIYEEIGKKYPWVVLPELLGENFWWDRLMLTVF